MRQFFDAFCFGGDFMKYLVTAEEMMRYDKNTTQFYGIPSLVLMERAALKVFSFVQTILPEPGAVLIAVGCGNNGGDGMALGRILSQAGYEVTFFCPNIQGQFSDAAKVQYETCKQYGMVFWEEIPSKPYKIVIDGLFGIGLNRNITGDFKEAITSLNALDGVKIAVDIPSGIHSDTGEILGIAFQADMTVTFGFQKRGTVFYPGCLFAGRVILAEIGIEKDSFLGKPPISFTYDDLDLEKMPARKKDGNKGTFGKVVMFAGSVGMAGAAVLAGKSCYRCGAGLLKIITPEKNREILQISLPEGVLLQLHSDKSDFEQFQQIEETMQWATCILAGPGIGLEPYAVNILELILQKSSCPLILDADAINLIAKSENLKNLLKEKAKGGQSIVLTPHLAEFSRLINQVREVLKSNQLEEAIRFAREYRVVLVCKDARTIIASGCEEDGIYINSNGNDGMATAGSGDILAGMITSLIAQGMNAYDAACLGVFAHAKAGDLAADTTNRYACMAEDMIEELKNLRKGIANESL